MKKLVCLLVFLAGASAMASNLPPVFEHQKVSYVITKNVISLVNDHYEFSRTEICRGEVAIDAYDFRNFSGGVSIPSQEVCNTMHEGKKILLSVNLFSAVSSETDFGVYDAKSYYLNFHQRYEDASPYTLPQSPPSQASIPDLNLRQMILRSAAEQYLMCNTPQAPKEFFKLSANSTPPDNADCKAVNPVVFSISTRFESL